MTKVTLDMTAFKALASDTRLSILRALDGKKLNLKELGKVTKLNKATLHEHLVKLNEAGLVKKKERDGHKWVYYKLTWKGEGLLHPENTRIVVMFSTTFVALAVGFIQMFNFLKGRVVARAVNFIGSDSTVIIPEIEETARSAFDALPEDELLIDVAEKTSSTYCQSPVTVPLANQTPIQLSQNLMHNVDIKGAVGNSIDPEYVVWNTDSSSVYGYLNETFRFNVDYNLSKINGSFTDDGSIANGAGDTISEGMSEAAGNIPSSMVAIVHDPALQAIAIICITFACVILTFAVWRYWKNRKPKL